MAEHSTPSVKFSGLTSPSPKGISRSILTPMLTPNANGRSTLLLSPARTITETLKQLSNVTGQQLEQIWDEVGYSPEDRANQLSELLLKFRDICDQTIAEEHKVAETYKTTIADAKQEIQTKASALKIDQNIDATSAMTLQDELSTLEATLETLRSAYDTAKADMTESLEFLQEAHDALGLEMDPAFLDIEGDLTKHRRQLFHEKKLQMKEELANRTRVVVQLVRDCQQLMDDLKMEPLRGSDLQRQIASSLVRSKKQDSTTTTYSLASKFRTDSCVGLSGAVVQELTEFVADLHTEKKRRKEQLHEMGGEIAVLWEKLRISEEEQKQFTKSVQGLGIDTIQKGRDELKRLHSLKSQMLGKLIEESRDTIESLWDQTNTRADQRRAFTSFNIQDGDMLDEELLNKHEEYIGELRGRLEQMEPIMRLIEKRETVIKERFELKELQKNPDRLKQRGAMQQRQAEEQMDRRIRQLPKLTSLLSAKLSEWKELHNEDFQYGNENYVDIMERQELEWNDYKEAEQQRKLKKNKDDTMVQPHFRGTRPLGATKHNQMLKQGSHQSHETSKQPVRNMGQKLPSSRF